MSCLADDKGDVTGKVEGQSLIVILFLTHCIRNRAEPGGNQTFSGGLFARLGRRRRRQLEKGPIRKRADR